MVVLGFVWLVLIVVDFTVGLSPILQLLSRIIWLAFGFDFAIGLIIAPHRLTYLRKQWLTALSLLLPALRVVRVTRVFALARGVRVARTFRLLSLLASMNRGMAATRTFLARRRFGYVLALTLIVTFAGAAGMLQFENRASLIESGVIGVGADATVGLDNYGEAVWWTAMIITSLGSEYWPQTPEGRILCWLIGLYGFAVFGYITATLSSLFVGLDAEAKTNATGASESRIRELETELAKLRQELASSEPPPS